MKADTLFMGEALKDARKALKKGEVPIGAVLVVEGKVVSRGHNERETKHDPSAHAELIAIRKASRKLGSWRLSGATLYVTLEPCLMCIGAIVLARIDRLVFGAFDPKAGAVGSLYDVSKDKRLNHRVEVTTGVMGEESGRLLKGFFSDLRAKKRAKKGP
ncbi:MAG: nucleoside deaminase [Deltaproteobacteria bacterium]|nr:nucleoside deaminase [Deltaproteobacteria bacterium]